MRPIFPHRIYPKKETKQWLKQHTEEIEVNR